VRILYLAHRLPYPPNKGDKIRTYHMVRHLAARHDVTCACFVDDPSDWRYVGLFHEWCRDIIALPLNAWTARARAAWACATGQSAAVRYYQNSGMARALARLGRFDAVIAFSACMAPYGECVSAERRILDLCDVDSLKWRAYAEYHGALRAAFFRTEARRLAEAELRLHAAYDATIVISEQEALDWQTPHREKIHVVGNGVKLPASPGPAGPTALVGFTGDMAYFPNEDAVLWFAREVWPHVRAAVPAASFAIAGRRPSRVLRALNGVCGISVLGEVPDMPAFLAQCQVVVAPLRLARGVQNKVLEAMAAARAVVATPAAAAGIDAAPGQHFHVAAGAAELAARTIALLRDTDAANALGQRARMHVAKEYTWEQRLAPLDRLLAGDRPPQLATRPTAELVPV
jgi:sugar transferase (PEP-CTERM/EpsH1 system associated)